MVKFIRALYEQRERERECLKKKEKQQGEEGGTYMYSFQEQREGSETKLPNCKE